LILLKSNPYSPEPELILNNALLIAKYQITKTQKTKNETHKNIIKKSQKIFITYLREKFLIVFELMVINAIDLNP
jgi:hypothetical protein